LKKILIIRFSSIGDIALTTPIIRSLKQQIDHCELHYLTKVQFEPLLKNHPCISKIFTIKKSIKPVLAQLRSEKYDYIVDLHNNIRSTSVILNLTRPFNSLKKLNFRKWLLVNLKINTLPSVHVVDRYFDVVEPLDVKNYGNGLEIFIDPSDEVALEKLPETHRNGFIGLVIGGKHATKRMPESKVISICFHIKKPIILLGGPEDFEKGEAVQEMVGKNVFNACGKFSIMQSASLVKQADAIISNDTGLMHIAAAFKKKVISIWGNTLPAFGMTPYFEKGFEANSIIIEVKKLSCRPCSKLGYEKCPKGHFKCMNLIDEKQIVNAIKT